MELFVSAKTLAGIFVFLVYAPIVLISYWKLIPRLSPAAKRIASGFLAAQVLVIAVSLEIQPSSSFERWLWHLNREWNIPSTLASTQLALVSCFALMTAWLAKGRRIWLRLYLLGIGLLFLYLARDEYTTLHESIGEAIGDWMSLYEALGIAVAVITFAVALCSPRRIRIWHLCLLAGLAVSAAGGLVIEQYHLQRICGSFGFLRLDKCLPLYNLEEPLEFLGIWLTLVAMLGHFSDAAPMSKPRVRRFLYALPALWILLLFQSEAIFPTISFNYYGQRVDNVQSADVEFEADIHLYGFSTKERGTTARKPYKQLYLDLFLSPRQWDFSGLGYSFHLVDQASGAAIAGGEQYFNQQYTFWLGPGYAPIYRQRIKIKIPPQAATNGALWGVLTVWREKDGEYVHQRVIASDHPLLDDTQVILGELRWPIPSPNPSVWYNSLGGIWNTE